MAKQWPLDHCKEAVARTWGKEARHNMGDTIYEALLSAELLILLAGQDDSVDPARVVTVMHDGRTQIIDEMLKET